MVLKEQISNLSAEEIIQENPVLKNAVLTDTELKTWLVEYVGNKNQNSDKNVTVEMIVEVVSREFPEFLLAVAEENWIRGYHQALNDVDEGAKLSNEK